MTASLPGPKPRVRVGIADLFSAQPDSSVRALFGTALLRAAAGLGLDVEVRAFGVTTGRDAASCGIDWALLPELDGLIVTGSEPTREDIADEPVLTVIEWLLEGERSRAASTLFSCQSAHAALFLLHGIRRSRLPGKKTGVFTHHLSGAPGPLGQGLPAIVPVPHSRWNAAPAADLRWHEVVPLLVSEDGDWHLAAGPDGVRHVFLQGHPEYLPDTLFREYRRDLHRFRAGAAAEPPAVPERYLSPQAERRLRRAASAAEQDAALAGAQHELDTGHPKASWTGAAIQFFANWMAVLRDASSDATPPTRQARGGRYPRCRGLNRSPDRFPRSRLEERT
jgi:homoserine O-succinyltransferase